MKPTLTVSVVDGDRFLLGAPAYGWAAMERGSIVAFRLTVTELQCKLKLNQHRPEAHSAMRSGYAKGNEQERALGFWMDRLGLSGKA